MAHAPFVKHARFPFSVSSDKQTHPDHTFIGLDVTLHIGIGSSNQSASSRLEPRHLSQACFARTGRDQSLQLVLASSSMLGRGMRILYEVVVGSAV